MENKRDVVLSAEHITVRFGGLVAVNDVSVEIGRKEIVGLIGANGAGKTTFFNAISGVIPPTEGTITIDGTKVEHPVSYKMCRLGIGRTYQVCQPFAKQTALENVMVSSFLHNPKESVAREKARAILEKVNLTKFENTLGADMSLIQLKRLELARALGTEPKVLLLDEVMAGLNNSECAEVMDLIRSIRDDGVSIVIVEHVMKAVMGLSERIYVLNQGKLIAEGTPQEISENPLVLKSYLGERKHATH